MVYKALGVPEGANVTVASNHHNGPHKRQARASRNAGVGNANLHANEGSKVNPLYLDSSHIPSGLVARLERIFSRSIATMRQHFGEDSFKVQPSNEAHAAHAA